MMLSKAIMKLLPSNVVLWAFSVEHRYVYHGRFLALSLGGQSSKVFFLLCRIERYYYDLYDLRILPLNKLRNSL